jgi:hypothetical protein
MAVLLPPTLLGQTAGQTESGQTAAAVLHTQGGVWINGSEATDSTAVFPGDLIETKTGFSGNLSMEGSTVLLGPESVAKLETNELELDHGTVSVGTSTSFRVRVNCIRVIPIHNEWTQYVVTDVDRTVRVSAQKLDVNVVHEGGHGKPNLEKEATEKASVHEGEQHNYDETEICGAPGPISKAGGMLNPKWIGVEAGVGGAVICIFVCRGSSGGQKTVMSPAAP